MAVSENPNRGAKFVPYIWLVYLAALFVQPAFDPSAGDPESGVARQSASQDRG